MSDENKIEVPIGAKNDLSSVFAQLKKEAQEAFQQMGNDAKSGAAQVVGATGDIEGATKKATAAVKESQLSIANIATEIKSNFTNAIKGGIVGMVGFAAAMKIKDKIIALHDANQKHNTIVMQLTASLGYYSRALNEQAEGLEKSKFVEKDEILQADQRLSNYFKEESQIKALIPAVLDLSKAKGIDLASAANLVAVAWQKGENAADKDEAGVGRLGIQFEKTGHDAEDLTNLVDALNKKFGAQSQAVADSLDGWSKLSFWWKAENKNLGEQIFGYSKAEQAAKVYEAQVRALAQAEQTWGEKLTDNISTMYHVHGQESVDITVGGIKQAIKAYDDEEFALSHVALAAAAADKALANYNSSISIAGTSTSAFNMLSNPNGPGGAISPGTQEQIDKTNKLQEEQGKNAAEQARKAAEEIRTVQKELITAQEIDGQTGYAKQRAELEAHYIEEQQEYAGNAKALEIINTKHYYDEANLEAAHDAETLKNQQETNKKAEEEASRTKKEQISTLEEQIREIDRQTREADRTIKEYWDALKRDNQEKVKDWTKMGDEVGAALAKGISGGKGGMKAAFKEVLNIELDFLEKKLQSTIIALTLGDITKLGWFGLAEAAVEGAAITGIFDVAKSKISAFALGTDYAPGGPAIINERGPEMVNLPRGTQVYNHTRTSNMTANSGHTFNIHVHDAQGNILESATAAIRSGGAERFVSTLNEHLQGLN